MVTWRSDRGPLEMSRPTYICLGYAYDRINKHAGFYKRETTDTVLIISLAPNHLMLIISLAPNHLMV